MWILGTIPEIADSYYLIKIKMGIDNGTKIGGVWPNKKRQLKGFMSKVWKTCWDKTRKGMVQFLVIKVIPNLVIGFFRSLQTIY